ncbi:hypothetical protein CC78DRAFT_578793 [Lojkania enalia]|uniref:Uncharacterized protein n=1 Tax=Lojkania enalia TaxID=147567 RepID=A0A9P4KC53_9PLEO|nr:hypothetical protein CC78DRAFT_578793 [Didymosphaeria enalia]
MSSALSFQIFNSLLQWVQNQPAHVSSKGQQHRRSKSDSSSTINIYNYESCSNSGRSSPSQSACSGQSTPLLPSESERSTPLLGLRRRRSSIAVIQSDEATAFADILAESIAEWCQSAEVERRDCITAVFPSQYFNSNTPSSTEIKKVKTEGTFRTRVALLSRISLLLTPVALDIEKLPSKTDVKEQLEKGCDHNTKQSSYHIAGLAFRKTVD